MKSSKLIIGCITALGLSAGAAVAQEDAEHAAIAERLAPVGELCLQGEDCGSASASAPAAASSSSGGGGDIDGEAIYNSVCMACHDTGAANAPIHGDEAAWADRVTKGFDTLLDHSTNGFNAMPARGGNPNLSDEEMLAVTKYMLEPVMDVPTDEASDDESSSDDAASSDDGAGAEDGEQAAADDSGTAEDAAQADEATQDDTEAADDSEQSETIEVVAAADGAESDDTADLPGASKNAVCVACHGQDGHGTAPMYPHLAGQNAAYLENALKAYRAGERKGGMSAVMTPMAAALSDEDIVDLAEYYSKQPL